MPTWIYYLIAAGAALAVFHALRALLWWVWDVDRTKKNLQGHTEWKATVNADRASFRRFMTEVRDKLDQLLALSKTTATSQSPLQLTDLGEDVSNEIHAKAVAGRLQPIITERLGRGSQAFDIHDACFDYVMDKYEPTDEERIRIRRSAYEHGLERDQVLQVIAIELRDLVLASMDLSDEAAAEG